MIIKKHLKGAFFWIVLLFFIALLGSGCSDEQPFLRSSQVETTFQLKSGSGLNGAFTIQHAYLKLDRVVISGASAGKNLPNATLSIPADEPPFRLVETDSSHISFTLPARRYDVMDLHLFLFADQYELVLTGRPENNIPKPVGGSDGGGEDNPNDGNSDHDGQNDDDDGNNDSGNNTGDESDEEGGSDDDDRDDDDHGDENENTEGDDRDDDDQGDDDNDNDDDDNDRDDGDDDEKDDDDDKKKKNDGNEDGDDKSNKDKKNKDKDDDDDDGKDDRRSDNAGNETVDLDHFFRNAKPGLVIFGTLEYNTQKINVIFVVTDPAEISVRAMQDNGSRIVLEEQNASVVSFDAEQWFEGLTEKDLEGAVVQLYQGQAVLFIHKDFNGALFEKLFSRLTPSATFRFDSAVAE